MSEHEVVAGGVRLAAQDVGEGVPIVLLHGLTASRRYVVMGSRTLERTGHRVVSYDARGHGRSAPAPAPDAYGYEHLRADLVAVLDERGIDRAVLAGVSMGAHTILGLAIAAPERVAALAVITPGYDPAEMEDPERLARWDGLSVALRDGGIDGFVDAYGVERLPAAWRETMTKVLRQRMAEHADTAAVADAMRVVPRSRPFSALADLAAIRCPVVVVADRDEADPGHPLALAGRYAAALPAARLVVEKEGESPLAWRGGRVSALLAELAAEAT